MIKFTNITIPTRVVLGIMLCAYLLSSDMIMHNLSLSIVVMVRHNNTNSSSSQLHEEQGEFNWSEQTQGVILSAYFWGYVVLQLPGGRLAEVVGGRRVMGYALLVASISFAFIPSLARWHYGFFVASRVLQGLALGVRYPTLLIMTSRWTPQVERARFMSLVIIGASVGELLVTPLSGVVIARLGWPVLFYLTAAQGLLVTFLWFLLVHDTPAHHPRISPEERGHIESGLVSQTHTTQSVPWRRIVRSRQVWMTVLLGVGNDWCAYSLNIFLPKYRASILHVNIQENSIYEVLPSICLWMFSAIAACISDYCLGHKLLSLTSLRRIAVAIAHLIPALILALFPLVASDLVPAVILLCLRSAFHGTNTSGYLQAFMDIAPNFTGTLMGLSNGLGAFTGIIAPLVVGSVLEHDASVHGWHIIFGSIAAAYVIASIPFICGFSAKVQPWNEVQKTSEHAAIKEPKIRFISE